MPNAMIFEVCIFLEAEMQHILLDCDLFISKAYLLARYLLARRSISDQVYCICIV